MIKQLQQKTRYLFLLSLFLQSALLVFYADLYLFSKFVTFPHWIETLPQPLSYFGFPGFTRVAILFCLLPITLVNEKILTSTLLLVKIEILAVIPVIIIYSLEIVPKFTDYRDWGNIPYQYLWIIFFHCLIPVFSVFLIICLKKFLKNSINKQIKNLSSYFGRRSKELDATLASALKKKE